MVRQFDAQRPDRPPRADRRRPSCVPGRPGRRVGLTRMCSSAPPRLLERGSRSRSRGRSPMGDSNLSPIGGSRQRRPRAILDVSSASTVVCLYSQNRSLLRSWGNRVSVTSGASVGEGACPERDPQRALPVPGTDGKRVLVGANCCGPPAYPSGRSWCGFGLSSRRIEDAWISATRAPPRPSRT
jgi:hypothetical protein